jgi:mono/diheme cytochrome c family protein
MKPLIFLILLLTTVTPPVNDNDYTAIEKPEDSQFDKGEKLFRRDCAACHYIGMDKVMTAPALGGITTRREKAWLYRYTRDAYGMFLKGDTIAKALRAANWGLMSPFPKLKDKELDDIYYFVEKRYEMTKKGIRVKE